MDERDDDTRSGMDRRRFIKIAGATGVLLSVDPVLARAAGAAPGGRIPLLGPVATQVAPGPTPSLTTVVHRRADMVRLRFEFTNVVVDRATPVPTLRLVNPDADGGVIVTFPPQALVEQAVPFPASLPTPGSLGARLASPSRLSFTIPRAAVASGIPYTAEGL
ncbi:MAG TPA: hypothetical protein VK866_09990, partial [Acidimicrobiales bacterium]|nr:hypothetical protein [Acidimicrobiales bacterium]